jgi:hypothetical protein
MTKTRALEIFLSALLLSSASLRLPAQGIAEGFVIDSNLPFVYLKFDHIGPGIPRWGGEPSARIWLQLTNNCRVPININTYGLPDGSPKEERGVMDRIVVNESRIVVQAISADGTVEPKLLARPTAGEMPHDYWFEVGSSQTIPPGKAILFSVPVNHMEERWHFEIPFRFELPKGTRLRDPGIGGLPEMFVPYYIYDIPPVQRSKIEP